MDYVMQNYFETMNLTHLAVEPKTRELYERWRVSSMRTHGSLFQQLVIHADRTGFDPVASPLLWPDQKKDPEEKR